MQFTVRKRRQPPAVIIISLIDILIVLLIFLMVTTTFKQRPSVRLTLPESNQAQSSSVENHVLITIAKDDPRFYFKTLPTTMERLQQQLAAEAAARPGISVVIEADKGATVEDTLKAMDAAKAAGLDKVTLSTKAAAEPPPPNR